MHVWSFWSYDEMWKNFTCVFINLELERLTCLETKENSIVCRTKHACILLTSSAFFTLSYTIHVGKPQKTNDSVVQ